MSNSCLQVPDPALAVNADSVDDVWMILKSFSIISVCFVLFDLALISTVLPHFVGRRLHHTRRQPPPPPPRGVHAAVSHDPLGADVYCTLIGGAIRCNPMQSDAIRCSARFTPSGPEPGRLDAPAPPAGILDLGLILIISFAFPGVVPPRTRRIPFPSSCPYLSAADWCLQSDVVPDSPLQVIITAMDQGEAKLYLVQ